MSVVKKETMHKLAWVKGYSSTVCGKGYVRTNKDAKVTCGRCKLLAKFAAKRAKKETR
jgi:hypothetical protein